MDQVSYEGSELVESYVHLKYSRSTLKEIYNYSVREGKGIREGI